MRLSSAKTCSSRVPTIYQPWASKPTTGVDLFEVATGGNEHSLTKAALAGWSTVTVHLDAGVYPRTSEIAFATTSHQAGYGVARSQICFLNSSVT
jgi:hypothetical protein